MEAETMTKKKQPITLKGLIQHMGGAAMARALQVDPSLPHKWAAGARPSVRNAEKIITVARDAGFTITLAEILGGAK